MPWEFRNVAIFTSAPSDVFPKFEISTRFKSSAAVVVEIKNAMDATAMPRQKEICMAVGYPHWIPQASEFMRVKRQGALKHSRRARSDAPYLHRCFHG